MTNIIQLNVAEIITYATGYQGVINPIIIFHGGVMGEVSNTNIYDYDVNSKSIKQG